MTSPETTSAIPPEPNAPLLLRRVLGLGDATLVGLGAIIGSGIFIALGPVARVAGNGLIWCLLLASIPAILNALASTSLGATYPRAGGTYYFGRQVLGPAVGFAAGWAFLIAKTASGAVMARGFGLYLAPENPPLALALGFLLIVGVTLADTRGPKVSRRVNLILVVVKVAILLLFVALAYRYGTYSLPTLPASLSGVSSSGWRGIWQGAALLFSVYAGYARLATLAEEVRDPRRTLPRAVFLSLGGAIILYLLVAGGALRLAGADSLASYSAPLADALWGVSGAAWAAPLMSLGAVVASASVFLVLLTGIARVLFAMSREGDLPPALASLDPRGTPTRAVWLSGVSVASLCLLPNLSVLLAVNSSAILFYYALTNICAWRLAPGERRYPRGLCVAGLILCVCLIAGLPPYTVLCTLGVVIGGTLLWAVVKRQRHRE